MSVIKHARIVVAGIGLSAAGLAAAQSVCVPPVVRGQVALPPPEVGLDDDSLRFEAGEFSATSGNIVELSDDVNVRYRDGMLTMDEARFDAGAGILEILGRGTYQNPNVTVFGEDAIIDVQAESASFGAAGFELPLRPASGSGSSLQIDGASRISLTTAVFTTCPPEQTTWELLARELVLDVDSGYGTARGVRLEFKGVPIFFAPYFTFPIDDRRKSGFLTPEFSERQRTGLDISVPYYFNLAPNYDLVLQPRYLSRRGLQVNNRFRYLLPSSEGTLNINYLPDDRVYDDDRDYLRFENSSSFGSRVALLTSIEQVSDDTYFEDLGYGLSETSQTHLNRFVDLSLLAPNWSLLTRLQNYQTIDAAIAPEDRPYERLPQFLFEGDWGGRLLGFNSDTELVYFDREVGATGWRFDSTNEFSLSYVRPGMYLTPAVALRQTNYWLEDDQPGQDDTLTRTLPVTSIDTGLRFERPSGRTSQWVQTLEPRVLYVNVPFEDQSQLPVFDTILPDFNLVQLFRKYQYVGPDRVANTEQISFGVTTRLINAASGRERLTATIGQTRYLETQRVNLPDQPPSDANASDYVAELSLYLSNKWNVEVGYQWNDQTRSTQRAETRFEFRPSEDRLIGVGYRYRPGQFEQGDIAVVWPIGEQWRVVGSYSYSLLDEKPLEQALGWEYEACCWRIRLFGRRFVSSRTGETDNSISIQLELKGFSDRASSPEELLDRGILGYRRFDNYTAQ